MTNVAADRPVPTVADVRRRLRRLRRSHSDRTLGEFMSDVYLIGFMLVVYGGSAAAAARRHLAQRFAGPVGFETTRAWLMVALLVVLAALAWRGLRALGPLLTTPAALSWCLVTPVDRAGWLRTPLWWLLGIAAAAGAATGTLAGWAGFGAVGASAGGLMTSLAWSAATGAAAAPALAAAAVSTQPSTTPSRRRLRPSDVVLGLGVLLIGAALATRLAEVHSGPPRLPGAVWLGIAVVLAAATVRRAVRALPHIDRAALTGGSQLGSAAVSAAVMIDPTFLFAQVEARRWSRPGRVHSRHLGAFARHWAGLAATRAWVLIQADLVRQTRRPASLFAWAALILAPYVVAAFAPAAASPARIVAGYLATERLAAGLRLVSRSAALRRILGGTDTQLRLTHLAVPALGMVVWWVVTRWSVPLASPALQVILVGGLLGGVYRTATRAPMSYEAGLFDTPMGPVPTPLLRRMLRGPDLLAVVVLLDLLL